jgi:hypothetical protein
VSAKRLDEQLDTSDIDTSRGDARRVAEIEAILDRTGVPRVGVGGPLDVVQRVSLLSLWAKGARGKK